MSENPVYKTCETKHKTDDVKSFGNLGCIIECYFKEKGTINETGSVIKEKFIELTEAGANGDAKWIEVMKTGAETCHNKCKEFWCLLIGHGGFLERTNDGVFLGIPGHTK
jgi:hypothetical protein